MEDLAGDNQTQENGTPDNNGAETIESIMGGMSDSTPPETKTDNKGTTAEGSEKQTKEGAESYPAWTQQLPEDLRNDADFMKQMGKFQKIGELSKAYSELEKKLGNSIVQPGENASNEEIAAFYERLGKPKTADGYSFSKDENAKTFLELAFNNNLTESQAKTMWESLKTIGQETVQQQQINLQKQAKETTDALRKEYGKDFNSAINYLQKGVLAYGGKELGEKLKQSGLLADKSIVDMFIKLGKQTSEAGTQTKNAGGDSYKSTVEGGTFKFNYN